MSGVLATKVDPGFRGGGRHYKFTAAQSSDLHDKMADFIKGKPDATQEVANEMHHHGFAINSMYVAHTLCSWGFARKRKNRKQINKFKIANLQYYPVYLVEVKKVPWSRLKFLDESSFNSRDVRRNYAYGPKGEATVVTDKESLSRNESETYTVTLMTSMADKDSPFVFTMKEGTNNQYDFLEFITYLVEGNLESGDVLVLDNCGIHGAEETLAF